ncbi:MAG: DUF1801 domain-containing protein [Planctomycetota bacterium]
MQSKAATVKEYLESLPADRRAAMAAVRAVILRNLDKDVEECMSYGMIGYVVPHRVYPAGYHCNPSLPLPYAGLASQKGYMSFYLGSVYCDCFEPKKRDPKLAKINEHTKWFRDAWAKTGKKLNMGKSCIRFKKVEDLALDVIGEAIGRVSAKMFINAYEASRAMVQGRAAKGPAAETAAKTGVSPRRGSAQK